MRLLEPGYLTGASGSKVELEQGPTSTSSPCTTRSCPSGDLLLVPALDRLRPRLEKVKSLATFL